MSTHQRTKEQLFGPFYVTKAPFRGALSPIGAKGTPLILKGTAFELNEETNELKALANVQIDFWQASGDYKLEDIKSAKYDYFEPDGKEYPYSRAIDKIVNTHGAAEHFDYRCRVITNEAGEYEIQTVVPKEYYDPADGTWRCPHIHAFVNNKLTTQIYFEGGNLNAEDAHRLDELTIKLEDRVGSEGVPYKEGRFDFIL